MRTTFLQWTMLCSWSLGLLLTLILPTSAHTLPQVPDRDHPAFYDDDNHRTSSSSATHIDNALMMTDMSRLLSPVRTTAVYSKLYQLALQEVAPLISLDKLKRTGGRGVLGLDNIDFAASMLDRARGRGEATSPGVSGMALSTTNFRPSRPMGLPSGIRPFQGSRTSDQPGRTQENNRMTSPGAGQRKLSMNMSVGDLRKLISMIKHG